MHDRHNAPFDFIPLAKFRRVYVTDRLERPERPGPSPEGAAIIMGNSVPTWHRSYWGRGRTVQADQAARMQEAYREALADEARNGNS